MDAVTASQGIEVITGMQLWFLFSLDSIKSFLSSSGFFTFFTFVSIIVTAILFIIKLIARGSDEDDKTAERMYQTTSEIFPKFLKASIILAIFTTFTSFVGYILPTTKQMAAIIVIPKIVNNAKLQEIPPKLIQLGSSYLDEWIDEFKNLDKLKKEAKDSKDSKEK